MGIGGVLALGCTIGQGLTGLSTLSLGSLLAIAGIATGGALGTLYLEEGALGATLRRLAGRAWNSPTPPAVLVQGKQGRSSVKLTPAILALAAAIAVLPAARAGSLDEDAPGWRKPRYERPVYVPRRDWEPPPDPYRGREPRPADDQHLRPAAAARFPRPPATASRRITGRAP